MLTYLFAKAQYPVPPFAAHCSIKNAIPASKFSILNFFRLIFLLGTKIIQFDLKRTKKFLLLALPPLSEPSPSVHLELDGALVAYGYSY